MDLQKTLVHDRGATCSIQALLQRCDGRHLEVLKNSAFGTIEIFNKLPEDIIQLPNGHSFQSALTKVARLALARQDSRWRTICSGRVLCR